MKSFNEFLHDVDIDRLDRDDMRERPDLHRTHVSDFIKQAKREVLQTIKYHYELIRKDKFADKERIQNLINALQKIINDPQHSQYRIWQK
jgi:hypothetical protein